MLFTLLLLTILLGIMPNIVLTDLHVSISQLIYQRFDHAPSIQYNSSVSGNYWIYIFIHHDL